MKDRLTKRWGNKAKEFLVGKKIVDVYYHTKKQNEEIFFDDYGSNVRIVFDDGHWITASRDDEGNGSGVIFTTSNEIPTIPTCSYDDE
jgi:hypothetical protein|tara:strand:- start:7 stop:270 length:264 start_codon:yes stop_codon:yes gene_type:complete